jgi:putative alpha-1,2-mannosidase
LFPVAGQSVFLVSTPAVEQARMRVAGGELHIETSGFVAPSRKEAPQHVQRASFDGRPLDRCWLAGAEVHGGGVLCLELGQRPSAWGRAGRPPSTPTTDLVALPIAIDQTAAGRGATDRGATDRGATDRGATGRGAAGPRDRRW